MELEEHLVKLLKRQHWRYLQDRREYATSRTLQTGLIRIVRFVRPILRILGNLISGLDEHAEGVLSAGFLKQLVNIFSYENAGIRKEAAWICSNVVAGPRGIYFY